MEDAEMYTTVYLGFIAVKIIKCSQLISYKKNGLTQWKKRNVERFHPVCLQFDSLKTFPRSIGFVRRCFQ